jgi:hypothetical protein
MLLLALSSCGWIAGLKDPLPNDGAGGEFCYGTGMLVVCFSAQPSGTQSIANSIDTGGFGCSANVVSGGDGVCVISGGTIDVPAGAMVNATNPTSGAATPLVLVADDAITIEGTLELGGGHRGATAAGAPFSGCQAGPNPNGSNPSGGGQGGSCAARGGDGGDGAGSASGGTSGAALAVPTMLHGGCPGARGGGEGGQGGHGGGAVYLIANHTITISGRLDASGGGGGGADGDNGTGGGGGGAGGMIVLDAPTIAVDGAVCAIGGSGAAGSTNGQSPSGGDATGGTTACAPGTPGHASSGAGDGGLGGIDGVGAVGVTGSSGGGGGGGGGSTGWVKLYGTKTGSGALKPAGT